MATATEVLQGHFNEGEEHDTMANSQDGGIFTQQFHDTTCFQRQKVLADTRSWTLKSTTRSLRSLEPFHAAQVHLTDKNRTRAADIDLLSHLYVMIFKGQSHYVNGGA